MTDYPSNEGVVKRLIIHYFWRSDYFSAGIQVDSTTVSLERSMGIKSG